MMKKITLMMALLIFLGTQTISAQCTTAADNWANLTTAGGAPCFNGTTCAITDAGFSGFGIFGSEAYALPNVEAGAEYVFDMCSGFGAGAWIPEITILADDGTTVDAWNGAAATGSALTFTDNCTLTWVATQSGTYTIIINELGTFIGDAPAQTGCGVSLAIDNGNPTVACGPTTPALCLPPAFDLEISNVTIAAGVAQQSNLATVSHTVIDFSKRGNVVVEIEVKNIGMTAIDTIILNSVLLNNAQTEGIGFADTIATTLAPGATYTHMMPAQGFDTLFPSLTSSDFIIFQANIDPSSFNLESTAADTSFSVILAPTESFAIPYSSSFELASGTSLTFEDNDWGWKFMDNDNDGNTFGLYSYTNLTPPDGNFALWASINAGAFSIGAVDETAQTPELTLEMGKAYEVSVYAATLLNQVGEVAVVLTDATNSMNTTLGTISLTGADSAYQKVAFQTSITATQTDYLIELNKSASGLILLDQFEIIEIAAPMSPSVSNTWEPCDMEATLTVSIAAGNTYTVDWGDGSAVETITTSNPQHTYAASGSYIVSVTATNILGTSAPATTTVVADQLPSPDANFTIDQTSTADVSVNFAADQVISCFVYDWNYGVIGAAHGTGANASYTYTENGTYDVTLFIQDQVNNTSNSVTKTVTITDIPNAINEIDFVNGISVFPNPVNDVLKVQFELNTIQEVTISLTSIDGKLVNTTTENTSDVNTKINTSNLASGIYVLDITTNEGVYSRNIMVK